MFFLVCLRYVSAHLEDCRALLQLGATRACPDNKQVGIMGSVRPLAQVTSSGLRCCEENELLIQNLMCAKPYLNSNQPAVLGIRLFYVNEKDGNIKHARFRTLDQHPLLDCRLVGGYLSSRRQSSTWGNFKRVSRRQTKKKKSNYAEFGLRVASCWQHPLS
jgi:hypothetical protein